MSDGIGGLNIEITASAGKASKAIDDLATKLSKLKSASSINNLNSLSVGLRNISLSMQGLQSVKASDFTRLASGIDKLTKIDGKNLNSVTSQLTPLSNAIDKFSKASIDTKGISSFATALSKLGRVEFNNSAQFGLFSQEVTKLLSALSGVQGVDKGITSFVSALSRLASAGSNTTETANGLRPLEVELKKFMRSINSVSSVNGETRMFISSLGQLANAGKKTDVTAKNLGSLAIAVKQFAVSMQSIPELSSGTLSMLNSLSGLSNAGSKAGSAMKSLSNASRSTNSGMKGLPSTFNKSAKSAKSLASAIGMMYAKFWLLFRIASKIKSAITSAMDYIEDFNYYDVAINKVTEDYYKEAGYKNAQAYKKAYESELSDLNSKFTGMNISDTGELSSSGLKNLGLNTSDIIKFEAQITQLTNSVGMLGTGSEAATKGLTMLSADISSLTNMDLSQVQQNLVSGISGMTMAVRKYGIDISNATLKQYALKYGIQESVSSMTQAEKTYLRMLAILDQSKISYGDLAKTINQPANQFRMLKNNIKQCGQMLGRLFLPIVQKVLPWLNAMTMAIKDLMQHIGDLFGIKWSDASSAISATGDTDLSGLEEDMDSVSDSIDNATDSAKKLNKQLQGFDELNNLTTSTSTGKNNSGSGSGSDVSGVLNSALIDAVEGYQKRWDKAFDGMTSKADELKAKIEEVFKKDWSTGDFTDLGALLGTWLTEGLSNFNSNISTYDEYFKKIGTSIGTGINGFITTDGLPEQLGTAIANAINLGLDTIESFIDSINFTAIGGFIASGLNSFISKDTFSKTTTVIAKSINGAVNTLDAFNTNFKWNKLAKSISKSINSFFKTWDAYKTGKALSGTASSILKAIKKALEGVDWKTVGTKIAKLVKGIDFSKVAWDLAQCAEAILKALGTAILSFTKECPVETNLIALIGVLKWSGITSTIFKTLASKILKKIGVAIAGEVAGGVVTGEGAIALSGSLEGVLVAGGTAAAGVAGFAIGAALLTAIGLYVDSKNMWKFNDTERAKHFKEEMKEKMSEDEYNEWQKKIAENKGYSGYIDYDGIYQEYKNGLKKSIDNDKDAPTINIKTSLHDVEKSKIDDVKNNAQTNANNSGNVSYNSALKNIKKAKTESGSLGSVKSDAESWANNNNINFYSRLNNVSTGSTSEKGSKNYVFENVKSWGASKFIGIGSTLKSPTNKTEFVTAIKNFAKKNPIEIEAKITALSLVKDLTMGKKDYNSIMLELGSSITKKAEGGFVSAGEFFIARESGPEMVGRMGNRTAVANNDQITTSISNAVYNSLVPVLTEVANSINRVGGQNTLFVEGVSEGDIVKIVSDGNESYKKRTGKPLFA